MVGSFTGKWHVKKCCVALTLLALQTGAIAPTQTPTSGPPGVIDILGLQIGMTPVTALTAIAEAGFSIREGDPAFSQEKQQATQLGDYIFYSAFKSESRGGPGSVVTSGMQPNFKVVAGAFTPEPGEEKLWGIHYLRTYGASTGPSTANTIESLVDKYGEPMFHKGLTTASFIKSVPMSQKTRGGTMLWYWTPKGQRMDQKSAESCRRALDNSYIGLGGNGVGLYNAAVIDRKVTLPDWENGMRAGCGRIIQASLNWDAEGVLDQLNITAIDLPLAYRTAINLQQRINNSEAERVRQRQKEADQRRPEF